MPGFDGTGPWGMGPGTGWGVGPCGGGFAFRRGFGRGWFGRGRGFGWRWMARNYSPQNELEMLKQQRDFLNERIQELESQISQQEE